MQKLNNVILIILFSLCGYLVVSFFTFFNPHFMLHEITKYNYYEKANDELIKNLKELEIEYTINKNDLKYDIEKYVKSRYKNYYIGNKIESTYDTEDTYLKYVKFDGLFDKYQINKVTYILFASVLVLIIFTGSVFNKTKNNHNLNFVLFISSIVMIILYGISYVLFDVDNEFINCTIIDSLHYLLGLSVILLEISLFKIVKSHFKLK